MTTKGYNKDGDFILVVCPNPSVDIFAWIEQIDPGKSNRIIKEQRFPGGKGVHVGLALAELAENVRILGFWGGPTGSWIKSECVKDYPHLACIGPELKEWSRSCFTYQSGNEFNETEVLGVGPVICKNDLSAFFDLYWHEIARAKCVVMSGSWPPGAKGDEYKRLVEIAYQYRKASLIDCTGDQLVHTLEARPYSVHLNRSEFHNFIGTKSPERGLKMILQSCIQLALTDGPRGLYLTEKGRSIHALSSVEQVHSTVGSGDCLVAGLAFAFIKEFDTLQTARFGASCGAANCLRKDLGLLFLKDVYHLYENTNAKVLPEYGLSMISQVN